MTKEFCECPICRSVRPVDEAREAAANGNGQAKQAVKKIPELEAVSAVLHNASAFLIAPLTDLPSTDELVAACRSITASLDEFGMALSTQFLRATLAERYSQTWSRDVLAGLGHTLEPFAGGDAVPCS